MGGCGIPVRDDADYMDLALCEAQKARKRGEVPVGAVVIHGGEVVGRGGNDRQRRGELLGHAEIVALRRACRKLGDWRLPGACLYVTLEPCPMCVGAMLAARIQRLVYAAPDPRAGAAGSVVPLADYPGMAHHVEVVAGPGADRAQALLEEFFLERRNSSDN